MYSLLMATLMCLPLAPFNPIEQDTLPSIAFHVMAGVSSPNGVVSVGPEVSACYEVLVKHPIVVRTGLDYGYGKLTSQLNPRGDLHTLTVSLEALYYRGTDRLTGYIGGGPVFAFNWFNPSRAASDSLWANEGVTDVDLDRRVGYRFTLGLRYHKSYSLEIAITELRPNLIKWAHPSESTFSKEYKEIKTGSFRVTFGYVLPITPF
jgi:hypothetical protein